MLEVKNLLVFYENALAINDLSFRVEKGQILVDTSSLQGGLLALGSREGGGSRLRILRPLSSPLYERSLAVGDLFLRFLDGSLLLGFPGRLLRADYLEG